LDRALLVVTRVAQGGDKLRHELAGGPPLPAVPSEDWLARRSVLLERITASSLRKVNAPFTWIWRVHPERHDQAQEMADRIWPSAVLVDEELTHDAVAPEHNNFIGVRLDADDALIPERLNELAAMDLSPYTLVNWWCGWKFNWNTGEVAKWEWPKRRQGPFLAVTQEGRSRMLDVPGPHNPARDGRHHIRHVDERSWIYTMHGDNVTSKWRGAKPLSDPGTILEEAGVCR
jgi:hypothetical protein